MGKLIAFASAAVMAVVAGVAGAAQYTGTQPYGSEWGLVDAVCGTKDAWPFRKAPSGMIVGGNGFSDRNGVSIIYSDTALAVTNTAYGEESDKKTYTTSPLWAPAAVYQCEVWGSSTTTIGGLVPNATYIVELHMAETYNQNQNRVFKCAANGVTLVAGLKPGTMFGFGWAVNFSAEVTADANGEVKFVMTGFSDNPVLGGYALWGLAAPTWTTAPTFTTSGTDVQMSWTAGQDVHRYYVEYSDDSDTGPWTPYAVLQPDATSCTAVGEYDAAEERYWRVVASNGMGTVEYKASLGGIAIDYSDLATLGETVASHSTTNYRVAAAGSGALNQLADTTTSAAMYVNGYEDDHTLAVAEGQTFSVGQLGVLNGAGDMTVGEVAGQGAVSPLAGDLTLKVKTPGSTLTVNSAIVKTSDSDTITKLGLGTAVLAGGTDIKNLDVGKGRLEIPNASEQALDYNLTGGGTLVKGGAGLLTVAKANAGFGGTVEVKSGTMAMRVNDAASAFGGGAATIQVAAGGTLDVANPNATGDNGVKFGSTKVLFAGDGAEGMGGAVVNSLGRSQYEALTYGEMTGDASIKAVGRFDFRNHNGGYFKFNDHTLTKYGNNLLGFTSVPVHSGGSNASLVVKEGGIRVESSTTFPDADLGTFVLDGGYLEYYNLGAAIQWPIEVTAAGGQIASASGYYDGNNTYSGPITIASGGTLTVSANDNTSHRITGKITGDGGLKLADRGGSGYVKLENTGNDYAGGTEVNNGVLYAPSAAVIPNYDKGYDQGGVKISGTGRLAVKAGDGTSGWSGEQIAALYANATAVEGSKGAVVVDTNGQSIESGAGAIEGIGVGKTGTGTYTAKQTYNGGGLFVDGGTLVLDNGGTSTFSDAQIIKSGRLVVTNSAVEFGNNHTYLANIQNDSFARVVLEDGARWSSYTAPLGNGSPSLYIGNAEKAYGVLEVHDGAVVSNKFILGNNKLGQGSVLQSGGEIVNWGGRGSDGRFGGGEYGYGYWDVAGGVTRFMGYSQLSYNPRGVGILSVRGGDFDMEAVLDGNLSLSRGGTGVVYQASGSFTTVTDVTLAEGTEWNGWLASGVVSLQGGLMRFGPDGAHRVLMSRKNSYGQVNIDGGVFAARSIAKGDGIGNEAALHVAFNGGTFKVGSSGDAFGSGATAADSLYVYENGATIDTDGEVVASLPFKKAEGLGVKYIDYSDTANVRMGAPLVTIIGDGVGATAVADFDQATGFVKGIIVTCPGWGYTTKPTVNLSGGGIRLDMPVAVPASAITMGASSAGGIVKKGSGTLTLNGANDFAGGVEVQGGTLELAAGASFTATNDLTLAGGRFVAAESVPFASLTVSGDADTVSQLGSPVTFAAPGAPEAPRRPGLYTRFVDGAIDTTLTATAENGVVVTSLEYVNTNAALDADLGGGLLNRTVNCVYDGYIWNRTADTVRWTFAEHFDDYVYLMIDDTVVLENTGNNAWTVPTYGSVVVAPGPHRFHLVVYQDQGGSGPCTNAEWLRWWEADGFGIGVDFLGRDEGVYGNYVELADDGLGTVFTLTTDDGVEDESFGAGANVNVTGGTLKLEAMRAGLWSGFAGDVDRTAAVCPRTGVSVDLSYANTAYEVNDYIEGVKNENVAYAYEGYIWNHGSVDATWTFAENFDDAVYLVIDNDRDHPVLNNDGWGTPSKGTVTLAPGAHKIFIGLRQGGSGSGPAGTQGNWTDASKTLGICIDFQGRDALDSSYFVPLTAYAHGGEQPLLTTGTSTTALLPATASIAVSGGGRVDLNGQATAVDTLYSGSSAFTNGTLRVNGAWVVDVEDVVAGNYVVADALDLTNAPELTVTGDISLLQTGVRYPIAVAIGGVTGAPTVNDPLGNGWSVKTRNNRVELVSSTGLLLFFR